MHGERPQEEYWEDLRDARDEAAAASLPCTVPRDPDHEGPPDFQRRFHSERAADSVSGQHFPVYTRHILSMWDPSYAARLDTSSPRTAAAGMRTACKIGPCRDFESCTWGTFSSRCSFSLQNSAAQRQFIEITLTGLGAARLSLTSIRRAICRRTRTAEAYDKWTECTWYRTNKLLRSPFGYGRCPRVQRLQGLTKREKAALSCVALRFFRLRWCLRHKFECCLHGMELRRLHYSWSADCYRCHLPPNCLGAVRRRWVIRQHHIQLGPSSFVLLKTSEKPQHAIRIPARAKHFIEAEHVRFRLVVAAVLNCASRTTGPPRPSMIFAIIWLSRMVFFLTVS